MQGMDNWCRIMSPEAGLWLSIALKSLLPGYIFNPSGDGLRRRLKTDDNYLDFYRPSRWARRNPLSQVTIRSEEYDQ